MSITESASREPFDAPGDAWGDGPASYEPGAAPRGPADRTPPQDMAAEQSVLGSMLISKDAIADVSEVLRGIDFYRPAHETIHDADHRPVRPWRAGRHGDRRRGAAAPRRAAADRRRPLPAHPGRQRADRGQRRVLRRHRAGEGDPAPARRRRHQDRADRLRRRGPGRRHRRPGAGGGLPDHRPPHRRGLRPAERHHDRRPRRDRGDRQPRGRPLRRPHRLRRPRRAHQRPARRPDGDRRGAARYGQVDAGSRPVPRGLDPEQHDQRLLQPGDDPLRDHHAAAGGRVARCRSTTSATAT